MIMMRKRKKILFRQLLGHPLACYSGCKSKLRVLRSATPHYPLMRKLLRLVYEGMRCNKTIDSTLRTGEFETLCKLCGIEEFKPLFSVRRSDVTADKSLNCSISSLSYV